MMKELRARGPILLDFNAASEFMMYHDGILDEENPVSQAFINGQSFAQVLAQSLISTNGQADTVLSSSVTDKTQEDYGIQWSKLTHSTLLIGYGSEDGENYWIVRNSYGSQWGESGNYRIRRGQNDFGCESENIAVTPYLIQ